MEVRVGEDWVSAARTVELGVAVDGNASAAFVVNTLVLTSGLTPGTALTRVELVVALVGFVPSVPSFGGLEVVVFAVPVVGKEVGLCAEVGESTTGRAVVVAGTVGTGCVAARLVLGANTVDEAAEELVEVVEVVVDVEVSGSGHGIATVTASATSVPLPSETMHWRLLAGIVASAVAVTVKSVVPPSFTRAIAGSNTKLTPSQVPSRGRIATGAERIAADSDSSIEAVVIGTPMFPVEVVAFEVVEGPVAAPVVEVSADTGTVGTSASVAGTDAVAPESSGFVAAAGDTNPLWESSGTTFTLCPSVAAARADNEPASPRDRAMRLTPWASRAA